MLIYILSINMQWPHNTGPMFAYLAKCEGTTCDKFDSSEAKWFKINQVGQKSNSATWFQQDIMNGGVYSVDLPSNLAAGDYLIRHEILALHNAQTEGGAEFYPSCSQLRVGGAQSGQPASTVSFPGAYSPTDPGILINVYSMTGQYQFPGPAVSNLAGKTLAARAGNETASVDSPSGRVSRVMRAL